MWKRLLEKFVLPVLLPALIEAIMDALDGDEEATETEPT